MRSKFNLDGPPMPKQEKTKMPKGYRPSVDNELFHLYNKHKGLDPHVVVSWARAHPTSALHSRFEWNDKKASEAFRIWQARELITSVTVIYPDRKERQVYVSPVESRGKGGYAALADVLSSKRKRLLFLQQALAEYERVGAKYSDLRELAGIRAAVRSAAQRARRAA